MIIAKPIQPVGTCYVIYKLQIKYTKKIHCKHGL